MDQCLEFARRIELAYDAVCKPACREWGLPRTVLDIWLFLANNPEYNTARDVVKVRRIKANLVSVHVERLVREGYIERRPVEGDRRKTQLICTGRAAPVIACGRALQRTFFERLFRETDPAQLAVFEQVMEGVSRSLDSILKGEE